MEKEESHIRKTKFVGAGVKTLAKAESRIKRWIRRSIISEDQSSKEEGSEVRKLVDGGTKTQRARFQELYLKSQEPVNG